MMRAKKTEIKTLSAADIEADINITGLKGSPTRVVKIFAPPAKGGGEMLSGSADEMVQALVLKLRERKIV
jgi:electron transfer flavoprotein beta subunit